MDRQLEHARRQVGDEGHAPRGRAHQVCVGGALHPRHDARGEGADRPRRVIAQRRPGLPPTLGDGAMVDRRRERDHEVLRGAGDIDARGAGGEVRLDGEEGAAGMPHQGAH